jgi:hypothetical protein
MESWRLPIVRTQCNERTVPLNLLAAEQIPWTTCTHGGCMRAHARTLRSVDSGSHLSRLYKKSSI